MTIARPRPMAGEVTMAWRALSNWTIMPILGRALSVFHDRCPQPGADARSGPQRPPRRIQPPVPKHSAPPALTECLHVVEVTTHVSVGRRRAMDPFKTKCLLHCEGSRDPGHAAGVTSQPEIMPAHGSVFATLPQLERIGQKQMQQGETSCRPSRRTVNRRRPSHLHRPFRSGRQSRPRRR